VNLERISTTEPNLAALLNGRDADSALEGFFSSLPLQAFAFGLCLCCEASESLQISNADIRSTSIPDEGSICGPAFVFQHLRAVNRFSPGDLVSLTSWYQISAIESFF
jgi:hypothetical protein